MGFIDFSRIKF